MIIIFDLDDTLYNERTYVESGLRAVSIFGYDKFGWDPDKSFHFMMEVLEQVGRGTIFDKWLVENNRYSKTLVKKCVNIYRNHKPLLSLANEARDILPMLTEYPLYIVTDGHKIVQQKKIDALSFSSIFKRIFITRNFGIKNEKPSTHCFKLIYEAEKCDNWSEMIYVGDNPAKDFVNINKIGMNTVRVMTGVHRNMRAKPGYDAQYSIPDLGHFMGLLPELGMSSRTTE